MALFTTPTGRQNRNEALRRVLNKDWADNDGRDQAIQDLLRYSRDVKPEEMIPLVSHVDPAVRGAGEQIVREHLDAKGAEQLFKILAREDTRIQTLIYHALIRAKPEVAVPHLQRLVTESAPSTAVRAMTALASLPPSRVGPAILRFLGHERREIRHLALVKVAESKLITDPRLLRSVIAMADDEDERVRLRVLEILLDTSPTEAIRTALQRLRDPSVSVQQLAVKVLSLGLDRLGDSSGADEQLFALLIDGTDTVRNGVLEIFMKRPDRDRFLRGLLVVCKSLTGWIRDRTLASLRVHADKLALGVIQLMSDPDDDVRAMALTLGATLANAEVFPQMVARLKDPDWMIRMLAVETLGRMADARAVPDLIEGLQDSEIMLACMDALATIRDPRSLKPIAIQLNNPKPEVRVAVLEALRQFNDPRTLPILKQVVERDPDPQVREKAAATREEIESGRPTPGGASGWAREIERRAIPLEELMPLELLLIEARKAGASDLHVVVGSAPSMRVHGKLVALPGDPYTAETSRDVIHEILTPELRETLESEQQLDFCHSIEDFGRFRCNVYVERKGLAASFRVIPREVPTLVEIGLPSHLADLVNHSQGLVVVAGPSGSGKSTTLAALVNLFNERRRSHILVLEDPIEFVHPVKGCLINQRQVGRHTRSFAAALRGALREDPDIIVVGDMRDPETVRLAIEASETGHLVIGTMNTTSAPKTVDRIIESFPPAEQSQIRMMLSETLRAIVCQMLIPNAEDDGRVACFEVLMGTLGVRNLIRENKTFMLVGQMQIGERQGHMTVDASLARLLDAGGITPEQAWLRAQNKANFEAQVSPEFLSGQLGVG